MALILGIDPGTRVTGYGLVFSDGGKHTPIDFGCIRPPATLPLHERYKILFDGIESLIIRYQPTVVAVESQFVLKNVQTAIKLGMAKGMVFLLAARHNLSLYEFTPTAAKLAVVGYGKASKTQVQKMIQALLKLPTLPKPEDAADALSLAICCAHHLMKVLCLSRSKGH